MDLVGRERELDALREALGRALQGSRSLVLVEGEPGIGKTSVLDAFRPEAVASGAAWLSGAAWEDGAPSYWPWTQVVRSARRLDESLVTRRAAALGPLGPLGTAGASTALTSDRFVMYDALAELLVDVAAMGPAVVVLEDLHAAGPSTADLLEYVHRSTSGLALLLVATLRPAEVAASPGLAEILSRLEGLGSVVKPSPFGAPEVTDVLAAHGLENRFVEPVLERTQGNPLFVAHLARTLASGGSPTTTGLPLGLAHALRRQAAAVEVPGAEGVLEAAAVLAEQITAPVLAAATGADPAAVLETLGRAVGALLLRPEPGDAGSYEFTHALVRQAVYDGITPARAAEVHLRVARALEAAGAGPDRLAWHFAGAWPAGGVEQALHYGRVAAQEAARAHAHAEAAGALRQALTAHDRLPTADPVERGDLLLALADSALRAGRADEAHRAAGEALALAPDPRRFARAALALATALPFNAEHADAVDTLRAADERFGDEDSPERAAVVARLAEMVALGDPEAAARLALRAEQMAPTLPAALAAALEVAWGRHEPREALARATRLSSAAVDATDAARAAIWRFVFALELGDTETAAAALTSLEQVADTSRQPALAHLALSRRATLTTLMGDPGKGLGAAREARDLAARFDLPDGDAVAWGQLFCVWRAAGLPAEDAAEMERVARLLAATSPYRIAHDGAVVQLLLARGERDAARELFTQLLAELGGLRQDLLHRWSLALLAEDAVALEDRVAARRLYDLLAPYGDRFVVAAGGVACLGSASHQLGLLAGLLGDAAAARAHLEAAVRAHREAGCTTLRDASQRALEDLLGARVSMESEDGVVTVRLRSEVVRLPASLGLTQLAVLVEHPGVPVAAARLVSPDAGESAAPELLADDGLSPGREADEVLDRRALASYRARLAEIDGELADGLGWQEDSRREQLEDERDALLVELRGALGLGGRQRRFTDEDERARVNVTRAIRSAIRKVAERSPVLGDHLEQAVSTGGRCCYDPRGARP